MGTHPSLYALIPNKEAIFATMVLRQRDQCLAESAVRQRSGQDLATRLRHLFGIWVMKPVAAVIDSENATELLANCGDYAPKALAALYAALEAQLVATLQPEVHAPAAMSAADIAYILRLATTSLKVSADNVGDLRRRSCPKPRSTPLRSSRLKPLLQGADSSGMRCGWTRHRLHGGGDRALLR